MPNSSLAALRSFNDSSSANFTTRLDSKQRKRDDKVFRIRIIDTIVKSGLGVGPNLAGGAASRRRLLN